MWSFWFFQSLIISLLCLVIYIFVDAEYRTEYEYLLLFATIMAFLYCEMKLLL